MRRPLLYGTVFLLLSVILFDYFGSRGVAVSSALLLSSVMTCRRQGIRKLLIICTLFFIAGAINCEVAVHNMNDSELYAKSGEETEIICKVISIKNQEIDEGKDRLVMTVKATGYKHEKLSVSVYESKGILILPGDRVKVSGILEVPQTRRNPGCFDYRKYLKSKGIILTMNDESTELIERGSGLRTYLYNLKKQYLQMVEENIGRETAGLVNGILFGDKWEIEDEILSEFQKNGTAHILAVSGLHVGIFYGFIAWIWPWKKKRTYFLFVTGILLCYSFLSELSPSVVRASIMVIIHLAGRIHYRKYDLASSAFVVVIIFVMLNPYAAFDPSFQMSFIAVLSMSLIMPYIKRLNNGLIAGSVAVQIGIAPYTCSMFNYFSPVSFLINIPVVAITGLIVPIGLVCLALCAAGLEVPYPVFRFLQLLLEVLTKFNSSLCIEGMTTFTCRSVPPFFMALIYLGMLMILSENGRLMIMRHGKRAFIFSLVIVIAASGAYKCMTRTGFEKSDVIFVDVGQGDCVHVRTSEGGNYLFDGGGKDGYSVGAKVLRPYLLKNGIRYVDGAIVSHLHTDHYKGIAELCREGMVRELFVYEANRVNEERILNETGLTKDHIHYLWAGVTVRLGKNASAETIWPERRSPREYMEIVNDEDKENEISLVMKVTVDDMTLLTTGDIDESCEAELVSEHGRDIDTDILKVAHHGSKYSSSAEFLKAVSPELAVIQVGRNTYGHPTPEALGRLSDAGTSVYRNDESGAVGVEIDAGRIKHIRTVIE